MVISTEDQQKMDEEGLFKALTTALLKGGRDRIGRIIEKFEKGAVDVNKEDLMIVTLISEERFKRASEKFAENSTRLSRAMTIITGVLAIAAIIDISLRIFCRL